ncbi:MAG: TIGR00730 family Rossman fold protein [Aureispira sp.]
MKVCVYAASSPSIAPIYFEATQQLAKALVTAQVSVIYGGGATGLMGQLADTVLAEGGQIKGIMPQFMNEVEWAHQGVTDFEFTSTMHERKAKFLEGIDAIITLPGGTGTLEELLEVMTLKRLGLFDKPIVILNTQGYYQPLQAMLQQCIDGQFLQEKHAQMWQFVDTPEEILPAIKEAQTWTGGAIDFGK